MEVAAISIENKDLITEIEKRHEADLERLLESHRETTQALQARILSLENVMRSQHELHVSEVNNMKASIAREQQDKESLKLEYAEALKSQTGNQAVAFEGLNREIERLQNALTENVNKSKEQSEAREMLYAKELLSQQESYSTRISQLEEKQKAMVEGFQKELSHKDEMMKLTSDQSRYLVVCEKRKVKEVLISLEQEKKKLEADQSAYIAKLEIRYQNDKEILVDNFKREIERLEKQVQILQSKCEVIVEEERQRADALVAATEAAHAKQISQLHAQLEQAEETYLHATVQFKEENKRLEKLYRDAHEMKLKDAEAIEADIRSRTSYLED
eukprot:gene7900-10116_t